MMLPLASVWRSWVGPEQLRLVMAKLVVVALVANKFPAVKAVELAYGNCDAATVEEEKKTPWV